MRNLHVEKLESRLCLAVLIGDWQRVDRPVDLAEAAERTMLVMAGQADYMRIQSIVGTTQPIAITVGSAPLGGEPQPAAVSSTRYDAHASVLVYARVVSGSATVTLDTAASVTEAVLTSSHSGSAQGWRVDAMFSAEITGSGEASFWLYAQARASVRRTVVCCGSSEVDSLAVGMQAGVWQLSVAGSPFALALVGSARQSRMLESSYLNGADWVSVRSVQQSAASDLNLSADYYSVYPWLYAYTINYVTATGAPSTIRYSASSVSSVISQGSESLALETSAQHTGFRGNVDGEWADRYEWRARSVLVAPAALFSRGSLNVLAAHESGRRQNFAVPLAGRNSADVSLGRPSGLPSQPSVRDDLVSAIGTLENLLFG